MTDRRWLAAVFLLALPAAAQVPDISLIARVTAKELRFEIVPTVKVTSTVHTAERKNLPDVVAPRTIYRDIGVILTITSTLSNIDDIVDEALGSRPVAKESSDEDRVDDPGVSRSSRGDGANPAEHDDEHLDGRSEYVDQRERDSGPGSRDRTATNRARRRSR